MEEHARDGGLTIISAIIFKVRTLCFCLSPFSSGGVSMYFFEKILPGPSHREVGNREGQSGAGAWAGGYSCHPWS